MKLPTIKILSNSQREDKGRGLDSVEYGCEAYFELLKNLCENKNSFLLFIKNTVDQEYKTGTIGLLFLYNFKRTIS